MSSRGRRRAPRDALLAPATPGLAKFARITDLSESEVDLRRLSELEAKRTIFELALREESEATVYAGVGDALASA